MMIIIAMKKKMMVIMFTTITMKTIIAFILNKRRNETIKNPKLNKKKLNKKLNYNNKLSNNNNNNNSNELLASLKLLGATKSNTVEITEHDNYKPHRTYVEYSNTPGRILFDGKIPNNQSNLTKKLRANVRNAILIEDDINI